MLKFIPAQSTGAVIKNHKSLRDFGLGYLLEPGRGFDGRMGGSYSDKEVDLSAIVMLGSQPYGSMDAWQYVACLQLAPGATVQRLVNAGRLSRDDKTYPGFTCFRSTVEPELSPFIAQQGATIAVGPESLLGPRLAQDARAGPIEKQLQPLADHDFLICCLTDYRDLALAEGYLQPLAPLLEPCLEDVKTLPPGACNAVTLALRLGGQPRLLVRMEAADESLAEEIGDLLERCIDRVQADFAALRDDLRSQLAPQAKAEVDQFLAEAVGGLRLEKAGQQLDVSLPLGRSGEELRRMIPQLTLAGGVPLDWAANAARVAVQRRQPEEKLRQVAIALSNHNDIFGHFPVQAIVDAQKRPLLSWRVALLRFLDEQKLYEQFKLDQPWDSEHNRKLIGKMPVVYRDVRLADPTLTTLQVFAGEGAAFDGRRLTYSRITDGTSNTLMLIQSSPQRAVPWTKPEDLTFVPHNTQSVIGKPPSEGTLAVMFDGRVLGLPADLSNDVWRRLIQPDDGEIVDLPRR